MRSAFWPDSREDEVPTLLSRDLTAGVVLVVDRAGGGLSGFAEVGLRPFAEGCDSSPVAYLEGIWVDPEARRGRIAAALVDGAEAWAREQGMTEMASDCTIDNHDSYQFHLATGFAEVERTICFMRPIEVGPDTT